MPSTLTIETDVRAIASGAAEHPGVAGVGVYVDLARRDVERASPRVYKQTITGDGTDEYALSSPWERGFSTIRHVRWVADNDFNAVPEWLVPEQYEVEYDSSGNSQIRLSRSPSSSDRVVVEFTARHTLTTSTSTTTVNDTEASALAYRAAALLLRAAATRAATTTPQATDADFAVGAIASQAGEFRRLADDADAEYRRLLGITEDAPSTPAFSSVPASPNYRNWRTMTHPRRMAT